MRKLIVVLVAGLLAACGGSSDGPTGTTTTQAGVGVTGVYNLTTVNGQSLPFSTTYNGAVASLTGDTFSLNADGTWSEVSSYRVTQGATVVTT